MVASDNLHDELRKYLLSDLCMSLLVFLEVVEGTWVFLKWKLRKTQKQLTDPLPEPVKLCFYLN